LGRYANVKVFRVEGHGTQVKVAFAAPDAAIATFTTGRTAG
jgi:hypothetical protein